LYYKHSVYSVSVCVCIPVSFVVDALLFCSRLLYISLRLLASTEAPPPAAGPETRQWSAQRAIRCRH